MSPQGGLVADAKLQGHNRRHGQTREREVEDARAALRHVDVEARRHDRALVDAGRTEFVVGGIGSSIMVGHDNW